MTALSGVLSATITPFNPDTSVDEAGLRALVDRNIVEGIHGIACCGSTGEFPTMTLDERRQIVEITIDATDGRVPVLANIGAMRTDDAVALAKHAEQAGATAVMAVAPYYEPLSLSETRAYFRTVADAITIPVCIYNLPVATGVHLSPEDIGRLAREVENIQYVKDTTGSFDQAARLIHDFGDVISTFVGWDTLYLPAIVEGAAGVILGAANFMTPDLVAIHDLVDAGNIDEAKAVWVRVLPVLHFLEAGGYVTAVRSALELIGHPAGPPRAPLLPLEPERRAKLKSLLGAAKGLQINNHSI